MGDQARSIVGFGVYQHHGPLCAPEIGCGWCDRERARRSPERVAIGAAQQRRIGRPRRYGKRRR
jgi:hypothetical protein